MPFVSIPDDVFDRLAQRAAALNLTIEQMVTPLLDLASKGDGDGHAAASPGPSFDEWKKKFDAWMTEIQARAHRYPPDFVMDDSRESIYEGCGE